MRALPLTRGSQAETRAHTLPVRALLALSVAAVLCAVWAPMLTAGRANLTSDESLYLAEAYSIGHGDGFRYPSGAPITHRAPAFPALLAPAVRIGGPDAAYGMTKAIVVINVLLLMLVAWRFAGTLCAAVAGITAAASSYLNGFGPTLYLDPLECTFLLLALLCLHEAMGARRQTWLLASGLSLGAAFLVKESAMLWAPLALCAWLGVPRLRDAAGARGAVVFSAAFAATTAGWWIWVYAQTSQFYLIGEATPAHLAVLAACIGLTLAFVGAILAWPCIAPAHRLAAAKLAGLAAVLVIAGWGAFMLFALTRYSTWGYPNDYWRTVPDYLRHVAPIAQPFGLMVIGWCWAAYRSWRGDDHYRLITIAGLLFVPFALFVANRGLQLRDALPLVYLSYLLLGVTAADAVQRAGKLIDGRGKAILLAALAVAGTALVVQQSWRFQSQAEAYAPDAIRADSWNNSFARGEAAWMEANLPAGSSVLSSRLYFSSLYVNTGGRFEIRQMPTVRVDVHPAGAELLASGSNLFRWGDEELRQTAPGDQWLYLKQFPGKAYWVGLSQQELLAYIAAHHVEYVVLTGDDGVFSSASYADYFSGNQGFKLIHYENASPTDQFFVYAVVEARPAPTPHSTVISATSLAALERVTGLSETAIAARLGTRLRVTDAEYGLSERERWAAVAGIDLRGP